MGAAKYVASQGLMKSPILGMLHILKLTVRKDRRDEVDCVTEHHHRSEATGSSNGRVKSPGQVDDSFNEVPGSGNRLSVSNK